MKYWNSKKIQDEKSAIIKYLISYDWFTALGTYTMANNRQEYHTDTKIHSLNYLIKFICK